MTTTTPDYLAHDDIRVRAVLALADLSAQYPAMDDTALELAVTSMLAAVEPRQAVNTFRACADDLCTAIDYDTRGGDAVTERLGAWSGDYLSADEKATDSRDEARESARLNAELLVSLQDALAVR
jgi:hypothetical protein